MTSTRLLRSRGKPLIKASEAQSVIRSETLNDGASCDSGLDRVTGKDHDSRNDDVGDDDADEANNNVSSELKRSGSVDHIRRSKKKYKEKELRQQIKVMKKDCKKLQKNIGQWMLETTPLSPSDLKSNVKQFLEANTEKSENLKSNVKQFLEANTEKSDQSENLLQLRDDLSSVTNVYQWNSPHIRNFFASNRRNSIQTNRLDIKLVCPIGKQRIKHPVRGKACNHVQPFDRDIFLKLERVSQVKKKKSFCPICNLEISSGSLVEDSFFVDVLKKSELEDEEVVVYADGLWHPSARRDKRKKGEEEEEVVLDDEIDGDGDADGDDEIRVTGVTKREKKSVVIDLTEDSFSQDDDDDDDIVML